MSIPQTPGSPSPYGYPPPGPPQAISAALPGADGAKPTAYQSGLRIAFLIIFIGGMYGLVFTGRALEALAVLGGIYAGSLLTGVLNFAAARIYGRRIVVMRFGGFGRLRYRATGKQLISWSAVPFIFSMRATETERSLGRGRRATRLATVALWLVLAVAGLLLAPDPGSVYFAVLVVLCLAVLAWAPDAVTGQRGAAKVLSGPDLRNTPTVADPRRVAALNAAIDAQFGDFESAQAVLARLEAEPEGAEAAALLRIDIATARGDFDAALALPWPSAAPDAPAHVVKQREALIATRRALLILFAAERNPQMTYQAIAEANALFTSVPRTATAAFGGPEVRAMLVLATGNAKRARGVNNLARGTAFTPTALADVLCDRALIESMTGDVRGRGSTSLAQAAQLAPWYPRVSTVHGMISGRSMPAQAIPMGAPVYSPPAQQWPQQPPPPPADPWDAPPA